MAAELNNTGVNLYRNGKYSDALSLFEEAVALVSKKSKSEQPCKSKNEMECIQTADTYYLDLYPTPDTGKEIDFQPHFLQEAFTITPPLQGIIQPHILLNDKISLDKAMIIFNIGLVYHKYDKIENALENFKLAKSTVPLACCSLVKMASANNAGQLLFKQGILEDALIMFCIACQDARKAVFEKETDEIGTQLIHKYAFTIFNNTGKLYHELQEWNKALKLCREALSSQMLAYGEDHFSIAVTYFNIGCINIKNGNDALALCSFDDFMDYLTSRSGNNPVFAKRENAKKLAFSLNFVGQKYAENELVHQAMNCFKKALKLGKDYIDTHYIYSIILYNVGLVNYYLDHNYKEASRAINASIYMLRKTWANDHPLAFSIMLYDIGRVQLGARKIHQARSSFSESSQIRKKMFGNDHRLVAECVYEIGNTFFLTCEYDKAMNRFQETQRIQRLTLDLGNPAFARTLCKIGEVHQKLNNSSMALEVLNEALSVATRNNTDIDLIIEIHNHIGHLHIVRDEGNEALASFAEMSRVREGRRVSDSLFDLKSIVERGILQKIQKNSATASSA